jgi:hypothetical protein
MRTLPTADESFARLHRAGLSVGGLVVILLAMVSCVGCSRHADVAKDKVGHAADPDDVAIKFIENL